MHRQNNCIELHNINKELRIGMIPSSEIIIILIMFHTMQY